MLWTCGSNGQGQLGLGHDKDINVWTPITSLPLQQGTVALAGGGNHTLVTNAGHAFAAGLGYGTTFQEIPHPIEGRHWIALCAAGWDFSVLVDNTNQIWVGPEWKPVPIPAEPVRKISCAMAHTVVLLESGDVWGWGASRHGQLGRPPESTCHKFDHTRDVVDIACGRDFTALLYSNGSVEVLGRFRWSVASIPWPVTAVYSGWSFITAVGPQNELLQLGNNSHGQITAPINKVDAVENGSEHTIAVTGNSVITWGWGEHGNCPTPFILDKEGPIVYAGCATSFVLVP